MAEHGFVLRFCLDVMTPKGSRIFHTSSMRITYFANISKTCVIIRVRYGSMFGHESENANGEWSVGLCFPHYQMVRFDGFDSTGAVSVSEPSSSWVAMECSGVPKMGEKRRDFTRWNSKDNPRVQYLSINVYNNE